MAAGSAKNINGELASFDSVTEFVFAIVPVCE
jgi:hypothetical protein